MVDTFARQRQLIASTAEWEVDDIVLALGEIGIEQVSSVDIRVKIGNGVDYWTALPYISTFTSNVNTETLDALAALVSKAGDTMTGALILAADPTVALGAVPKQYADAVRTDLTAQIDTRVIKTGDTMSGFLSHDLAPTAPQHTATKGYVDTADDARVAVAGDTMTGPLVLSGPPTDPLHATTKTYVDDGDYQSVVGGDATYAGKVVKLNSSGMLDTSIVPVSSTYIGTINLTLSYTLTGSYTVGSYFAVLTTGTIDASWYTKINGAPTVCTSGQMLIYNANNKWDLIGEAVSDAAISGKVNRAGDTMTGALILAADPTVALGAATKQYADTKASVAYVNAGLATKQATGDYSINGHTHTIANVTGLQTALDAKAATSHTHTIANVTGLQTALDGKQASGDYSLNGHIHTIANITGLQTALDGKQAAGSYAAIGSANTFTAAQTVPNLKISDAAGTYRNLEYKTGSALRWGLLTLNGAETGSDAGSDFAIYRYNDAGGSLGSVLSIVRATGVTTIKELLLSTNLAVSEGGTGAADAATARTNLGLAIGTNVQAYDGDLAAIAALSGTSGFLKKTAANTWALDTTTLVDADIGVTVQAYDADLGAIAALSGTSGYLKKTAANTWTLDTASHLDTGAIGVSVQAYDGDLAAIAALSGTSGYLKKTAANTWTLDTAGYAPIASPTFTGTVTIPTLALTTALSVGDGGTGGDGTVTGSGKNVLATSPALAGTPTAPTAASGTNTTQIATTAFVQTTANEICKLLGTITTTASPASLSSLTLTPYKYLMLVFNGCNTAAGAGATTTLNSLQIASSSVGGALNGHMFIDLGSGVGTSMLGANGVQAGATGITTATTTITFTRANSNAGSIRVYGIQ